MFLNFERFFCFLFYPRHQHRAFLFLYVIIYSLWKFLKTTKVTKTAEKNNKHFFCKPIWTPDVAYFSGFLFDPEAGFWDLHNPQST